MITLGDITWENFDACLRMRVKDEQDDFIADNIYSLAQSYVELLCDRMPPITKVIYADGVPVGFVMAGYNSAEEAASGIAEYCICRFMIDRNHQGKGYGREAFSRLLEYLLTFPQGKADRIELSYNPANHVAKRLYESFGFRETGETDGDEIVSVLML